MLSTILIGCALNLVFASFMVSYSSLFTEPVLIPSPELLDGHVSVSSRAQTPSLSSNAPQECIRHRLFPLPRCSAVPLVLRSLYSPRQCSKRSVQGSSPLDGRLPVSTVGCKLGMYVIGSGVPYPLPDPGGFLQIWGADTS